MQTKNLHTYLARIVLRNALALIRDPSRWIQGETARDSNGHIVSPTNPEAVSYCAIGALCAASVTSQVCPDVRFRAKQALGTAMELPKIDNRLKEIAEVNDTSRHSDVVHYFETAIQSLTSQSN